MRGSQTLFQDLIEPPLQQQTTTAKTGRSALKIIQRDTRLLHRYYYYAHLQRRQYDDIIAMLDQEFDLTGRRIIECMTNKHPELKAIFSQKPDVKALRQLYPFMNWPEIQIPAVPAR